MKKLIGIMALTLTFSTAALSGTLDNRDSASLVRILQAAGVQNVPTPGFPSIVTLSASNVSCEGGPKNACSLVSGNRELKVDGANAVRLAALIVKGGASVNNARIPNFIAAASVACVMGSPDSDPTDRPCEIKPANIAF